LIFALLYQFEMYGTVHFKLCAATNHRWGTKFLRQYWAPNCRSQSLLSEMAALFAAAIADEQSAIYGMDGSALQGTMTAPVESAGLPGMPSKTRFRSTAVTVVEMQ
jgi:hypothetical protein